MKKILVAFDGSSDSTEALNEAVFYTKKLDGTLTVLYINDEKPVTVESEEAPAVPAINYPSSQLGNGTPVYPLTLPANYSPEKQILIDDDVDQVLDKANLKLHLENIDYKLENLPGDPAKGICEFAANHEIDLIVVGNRGVSGIKKLFAGSVSEKVVNEAPCPVLVVK